MINTHALALPISSSLEVGLRADCARLMKFEAELSFTLEESHELANARGSPADWNTGCQHHWDHVMAVLRRIHRLLGEMNDAIGSRQPQTAWKLWEELPHQEARLANALSGLNDQAAHLNEAAAGDWRKLVLAIEFHRKAVQACVEGLHIRLRSWAVPSPRYAVTEAMAIAALEMAAAPPVGDEAEHLRDLDHAAIEIEAEQHQELGLLDGLKALFMWVEAPGERVHKKHPNAA